MKTAVFNSVRHHNCSSFLIPASGWVSGVAAVTPSYWSSRLPTGGGKWSLLLACFCLGLGACNVQAAAGARRVLIVHSFGSAAPPFTTTSVAFETELTEKMGERVDLDEVSLDMARYPDPDMQEALVEYLQKRQAKWKPDLVVPIGSPAAIFVAQYRERLFPYETPILYCGLDQRRLPAGALQKNATFVGESFNVPGFVEDMLQLAPATTNIAVVIGSSRLEQYWAETFRQELAPYTNRLGFTWLNDLSFEQVLDHAGKLPPRSFILLTLLLRDSAGVSHNADEAIKRLHAAANAPLNSIFQNQLGLGIVGGRLYQPELEGQESARIAIRILRGEPASSFPPRIIDPLPPRYDWRELKRWNIPESRLPAGSTVLFRVPSSWKQNWNLIAAIASVTVLEAILIFVLVANLARRRRAERSLAESESRFRFAADAAPVMIWMTGTNKHCTYVNKPWLQYTGRTLEQELGEGWAGGIHPDDGKGCLKTYSDAFDARQPFVMEYRLRRHDGEYRWISDSGRPRTDKQGEFLGYVGSCIDITASRLKTEALIESETRLRSILDTAVEAIITVNERGVIQSVNAATHRVFGYPADEMIGQDVGIFISPPFHTLSEPTPGQFAAANPANTSRNATEARGRRKDGMFFPVEVTVSLLVLAGRVIITGFVRDITERRHAEQAAREFGGRLLQAQEAERARLARELHDDITQRLARLAIDAGRMEPGDDPAQRAETLRDVREGLVRLSEDIHALSYRLHPSMLRDLGLAAALRAECERFSRQSAIATEVRLAALPPRIAPDAALSIFRIAQEALRNVARHAGASAAKVSLRPLDDGLQLAVMDSGVGFDPGRQRRQPSLGLASMQERVRLLGGELEIESAPGQGTTILAWVPLEGKLS